MRVGYLILMSVRIENVESVDVKYSPPPLIILSNDKSKKYRGLIWTGTTSAWGIFRRLARY